MLMKGTCPHWESVWQQELPESGMIREGLLPNWRMEELMLKSRRRQGQVLQVWQTVCAAAAASQPFHRPGRRTEGECGAWQAAELSRVSTLVSTLKSLCHLWISFQPQFWVMSVYSWDWTRSICSEAEDSRFVQKAEQLLKQRIECSACLFQFSAYLNHSPFFA